MTPEQLKILLQDADFRKTAVASFKRIRREEGATRLKLNIGDDDERILPLQEADDFLMKLLETPIGSDDPNDASNPNNFSLASTMYDDAQYAAAELMP